MKLSELALQESEGILPFLLSLFFVRLVEMVGPHSDGRSFLILGVPPWRSLQTKDCYTKKIVQVA